MNNISANSKHRAMKDKQIDEGWFFCMDAWAMIFCPQPTYTQAKSRRIELTVRIEVIHAYIIAGLDPDLKNTDYSLFLRTKCSSISSESPTSDRNFRLYVWLKNYIRHALQSAQLTTTVDIFASDFLLQAPPGVYD